MISPLQGFDAQAAQVNNQLGMQRGQANSPFTALGTVLKGTLDTYNANLATQQTQANAMALQGSKNQTDLDVAALHNQGAKDTASVTGNKALEVEKYKAGINAPTAEDQALYRDMQMNPNKYVKDVGPVKTIPHVKYNSLGQPIGVDYRDVRTAGVFDMASMGGEDPADAAPDGQGIGFNPFNLPQTPAVAGQGKQLTPDVIKTFVAQAKGDPALAKQLAAQAGYR